MCLEFSISQEAILPPETLFILLNTIERFLCHLVNQISTLILLLARRILSTALNSHDIPKHFCARDVWVYIGLTSNT